MGGPVIYGFGCIVELEKSIDQAAGEAIATANPVHDFKSLAVRSAVELAIVPTDRPPIIDGGTGHGAQSGGRDFEVRKFLDRALDHGLEAVQLDVADMLVHAFDFHAQTSRKILFIADHDIDAPGDPAVHFLGAGLAANALPEARPVVQVVTDDRSMFAGALHGFNHDFRGGVAERRENPAGMEPAHPLFAEEIFPIDVSRFELAGGGVAPVRDALGSADAETTFSEIEPNPDAPSDPVVGHPLDPIHIHAALHDEVLHQPADVVVRKRGDNGGAEAEAFAQAPGHIVFAAPFPDFEFPRDPHPAFARIEAEHDFAKGDAVV